MFKGITPATVRECKHSPIFFELFVIFLVLQKLFFDRLTQSINFVDEVQKAMELLTIFNPVRLFTGHIKIWGISERKVQSPESYNESDNRNG